MSAGGLGDPRGTVADGGCGTAQAPGSEGLRELSEYSKLQIALISASRFQAPQDRGGGLFIFGSGSYTSEGKLYICCGVALRFLLREIRTLLTPRIQTDCRQPPGEMNAIP